MQKIKWLILVPIIVILVVIIYFATRSSLTPTQQTNTLAYSYTASGLTFKSPLELKIEEGGVDAMLIKPVDTAKQDQFYSIMLSVPEEMVKTMSPDEIVNYAKTTYMGSTKPSTGKINRTFFEKSIEGTLQEVSIPRPSTLETYLIHLPSNKIVFWGIKYSLPKTEANFLIDAIATSMNE